MGNLCDSCFGREGREELTNDVDPEIRRQQALEAAERRQKQNENRGIKNPERVRYMEERQREKERIEEEAAKRGVGGGQNLRWTSD